jgi:hypothetical protein
VEQYSTALQGRRLQDAIGASDSFLNLNSIPDGLLPGTYRFRIDSEILTGDYATGLVFTNLQRGLEGSTAAAHRAGVLVRHVVTGESIQNVLNVETQDGLVSLEGVRTLRVTDGSLDVDADHRSATIRNARPGGTAMDTSIAPRPAAVRLFQFNTFN